MENDCILYKYVFNYIFHDYAATHCNVDTLQIRKFVSLNILENTFELLRINFAFKTSFQLSMHSAHVIITLGNNYSIGDKITKI